MTDLATSPLHDHGSNHDSHNYDLDDVHVGNAQQAPKSRDQGMSVLFKNLSVFGTAKTVDEQHTALSVLEIPFRTLFRLGQVRNRKQVLHNLAGLVKQGEVLAVLGRPGSGCSTFLQAISGELKDLHLSESAEVNFNGIPQKQMCTRFKGEINYNAEIDQHFPQLTVGQTLIFAAALRTPHTRPQGTSRDAYAVQTTEDIMKTYGLGHTRDTKVGNEFARGISGGERKRLSIAEMHLSGCSVACWDQSTRGLDSTAALQFVLGLKNAARESGSIHIVSLYQASDTIVSKFDKVIVLYDGREIYFGPVDTAKKYFEDMGWYCPPRQPMADFLTACTNPVERQPKDGFENRVPRTPDDFVKHWEQSKAYQSLQFDISEHEREHSSKNVINFIADFEKTVDSRKGHHISRRSPYLASTRNQIRYCTIRAWQRIVGDKTATLAQTGVQVVLSFIIGSMFYQVANNTDGLFSRGGVLFGSIMLNAIVTVIEIFQLYTQRPIVEKQASYAFYRPWTEAMSGLVISFPLKLVTTSAFNIILYFLAGLRKAPSNFFIFYLFCYVISVVMALLFRTIGASTSTLAEAFVVVGVVLPLITVYTGFVIPMPSMHVWFKWLTYINPISYGFESLIVNEFHNRNFTCTIPSIVPPYAAVVNGSFVCSIRGSVEDEPYVSGDAYVYFNYDYQYSHLWRNLGISFAFLIFFLVTYLIISERNQYSPPSTNTLVFRRGHEQLGDVQQQELTESQAEFMGELQAHESILGWQNICYDILVKDGTRRLLSDVSGWVKPGSLTALMGVSGAGKTTLLDALAQRTSVGVVSGGMFLNGHPLPIDFQRNSGYVLQQDLHVETSSVREALRFSAMLRQPKHVSKVEKYAYVEKIIKILGMSDFAEAIVGSPGQGLNVERRKLLSIGVELAARPSVLLFLDEPTTGLDSQSAYGVITFLRMLANSGQCVLCTIHQPSAILFQQFDRLLLLVEGGKTAYFGSIGSDSLDVVNYFEQHGARECGSEENPAEYIIEVVSQKSVDWAEVWRKSDENTMVAEQLEQMQRAADNAASSHPYGSSNRQGKVKEFAMPFQLQFFYVTMRILQQYWRTPKYVWDKLLLAIASSLFIGFTFYQSGHTIQGIEDTLFAAFMQVAIIPPLINQILPKFVSARELYEVRERPSKTYSWRVFLLSNSVAELPYQILMGVIVFAIWNYTVLGIQDASRAGLILLFTLQFFIWASTYAHMVVAALPNAETAAILATVMFVMSLLFSGVLQPATNMPGFWHFLWRVSPITYLISGVVSTGLHNQHVQCAQSELSIFNPPAGSTCAEYLQPYLQTLHAPGYLLNPNATVGCEYCPLTVVDQLLAMDDVYFGGRWRNFGLIWVYIGFNIVMTIILYYLFRVGGARRIVDWIARKRRGRNLT